MAVNQRKLRRNEYRYTTPKPSNACGTRVPARLGATQWYRAAEAGRDVAHPGAGVEHPDRTLVTRANSCKFHAVATPTDPIRLLVVDDNPVVRAVLRDLLDDGRTISIVAEAANGDEALRQARTHRPDVTLLDHRMPVHDGLSVVTELSTLTRVVMLTRSDEDGTILHALRSGASGYLIHGQFTPAQLAAAIREVAGGAAHLSPAATAAVVSAVRGGVVSDGPAHSMPGSGGDRPVRLSAREREIADLIAAGHSNRAIADRLFLASKTIENHVNHIFAKLGAATRAEAIAIWRRYGTR